MLDQPGRKGKRDQGFLSFTLSEGRGVEGDEGNGEKKKARYSFYNICPNFYIRKILEKQNCKTNLFIRIL